MVCRLCGSKNLLLYYKQGINDQFKYYKCNNCKLINLDLRNVKIIENQDKYQEVFKPIANYDKEKASFKAYLFITSFVPPPPGTVKKRFLDIGWGRGQPLYFFKKNGWIVKGLELSPIFAEYIKKQIDIDVEVSDFMKYNSGIGENDLVCLRHVLEHIPDSVSAMNKIASLLKRNAYAYFEFPNINGLSHRIQRLRNHFNFLKKKFLPSYVPGHCNEFSRHSFEFLLKKTGFRLIKWETYSNKFLSNLLYKHVHIGTKARVIVQKT